jgi:hypothetical protein
MISEPRMAAVEQPVLITNLFFQQTYKYLILYLKVCMIVAVVQAEGILYSLLKLRSISF